eukprot:m.85645 g.85645  ORF g.85645 m.85645 type:complete len:339 (+) comp9637_c0_seq2:3145-4161(+)
MTTRATPHGGWVGARFYVSPTRLFTRLPSTTTLVLAAAAAAIHAVIVQEFPSRGDVDFLRTHPHVCAHTRLARSLPLACSSGTRGAGGAGSARGRASVERDADFVAPSVPAAVHTKRPAAPAANRASKRKPEPTSLLGRTSPEVQSSNEVVSFDTAQRTDSGLFGTKDVGELLPDTALENDDDDIQLENASAWLSFGADDVTGGGGVGGGAGVDVDVSDFSKFQQLSLEKKVREQSDAEEAQRLEQERLQAEAKKRELAEQQRLERERQQADLVKQQAEEEAKRQADEAAERERLREEAKREREAMTGHMDLHQQSTVMAAFGNDGDDDDDLANLLEG